METQANGPVNTQAQEPVHPIHEETATLERLTQWVSENPDNDPHAGTDMEAPKKEPQAKQPASEEPENQETQEAEAAPEGIEIPEEDPLFDIEYKTETGKEKKRLSLKDLREGYLAKQDYHRNIQKVKQQEAQLQEHMRQAELKAAQEVAQKLETQKQLLQRFANVRPMQEIEQLSREDPAAAQQEFLRLVNFNQAMQQLDQEQQAARQKMEGEQRRLRAEAIEKARVTLQNDIEGWSGEHYNTLLKTGVEDYGFEPEVVSNVVDPRFFKVLNDAYKYRQLQKAKPEANKRVVTVPKVLKPGSVEKPSKSDAANEAAKRLKKSGRGEDFVNWYLQKNK